MDRAKKPSTSIADKNSKIYMDLKDIVRENVLHFLPAKSLIRCTAVCRDWKKYISSPFFTHNQSNSFRHVSGFFCQSSDSEPSFTSLDLMAYGVPDPSLKFLPEPIDIRCSSNGFLCCQGKTGCRAYYICNPVTQQWKKLPKPDADHGPDPALVLFYEPSLLNFVADYKLICAFQSDMDGLEFDIYSSAQGSWRTSGEICFGDRQIIPTSGVHVGGVVYWNSRNSQIVAFDLASERSTILWPSGKLGVMNGRLCRGSVCGSRLTLNELSNAYTNTMQIHSQTKAWETKEIINSAFQMRTGLGKLKYIGEVLVIQSDETCISYNMKTKEVKRLAVDGRCEVIVSYVNSLVEILD